MPEKKSFRDWRKEKGYTTRFVSEQLGISIYSVNAKERGEARFTKLEQCSLCKLYDITLEQVQRE